MDNKINYTRVPKSGNRSKLLLGTVAFLVIAFLVLITLVFVFSAFSPNLIGKCVAVISIDQPLTTSGVSPSLFSSGYLGSEDLSYVISSLNKRDDVGAVVFVMNSPGGSVVATREIYTSVKELNKPKVAYFREMATSGAYYISTGTDYIITEPSAITGSIGVITTVSDMSGLFDKLGINMTSITSGDAKDFGSPYKPLSEKERNITQIIISEIFGDFKSVVISNRGTKLNDSRFTEILDGRILSGKQAVEVGLADGVGMKRDAILKAAKMANISTTTSDKVRICSISTSPQDVGILDVSSLVGAFSIYSGVPQLLFK